MRPRSIVRFEQIFLAITVIGAVSGVWTYLHWSDLMPAGMTAGIATMMPVIMGVSLIFGIGINILLWYFIARRGSKVAKWIFIVFFAMGLLAVLRGLFSAAVPIGMFRQAVGILQIVLEAIAVWLLFRPDATRWFKGEPSDDLHDVFS